MAFFVFASLAFSIENQRRDFYGWRFVAGEIIMQDENPYASPTYTGRMVEPPPCALFRKGNLLVMHKDALLPNVCVKTNRPVAENDRLKRNLVWHHPAIYLTLLLNLLIYIVLAVLFQKKATVRVGLCKEWFRKRRLAILIGWLSFIGAIAAVIVIGIDFSQSAFAGLSIFFAVVAGISGVIYGMMVSRIVTPVRITRDYIWLKGVHPEFLQELPAWPHEP